MTKKIITSSDYKDFITNIKKEVIQSRNNALKVVNKELINLYWIIWESIFKKQENSNWWDDIIWQLSKDLTQEFWKWYSKRNLLYMKKSLSFIQRFFKSADTVCTKFLEP